MKHKIVEVKNMIKTEQLLDNLLNRSSIVPGIGSVNKYSRSRRIESSAMPYFLLSVDPANKRNRIMGSHPWRFQKIDQPGRHSPLSRSASRTRLNTLGLTSTIVPFRVQPAARA